MSKSRIIAIAVSAAAVAMGLVGLVVAPKPAAAVGADPFGRLERVSAVGAQMTVSGWAADPSSSVPIRIGIRIDGIGVGTVLAASPRGYVAVAYPKLGGRHGFATTFTESPGQHSVCVSAVNIGAGATVRIGCKAITIEGVVPVTRVAPPATAAPFGYLDRATYSPGKLTLIGWSIDPDTTDPTLVDLLLDGVRYASVAANAMRPDVAAVYPASGGRHGFSATMVARLKVGNHRACVLALNTSVGASTALKCLVVNVAPPPDPAVLNTATAAAAADALQAQAITSGAARATQFPVNASSAYRIAIATRALLEQATGHRAAPPARPGVPAFQVVTPTKHVDVQAVMGPAPNLGTFPAVTGGERTTSLAPQVYRNDPLPTPSGAGAGLAGAAPVLPANGRTVRPILPAYPAGALKLRAEVALDAALRQMGVPYVYAAAGPNSFDCSGLTMWAWSKAGVDLYHFTGTQRHQGVRVLRNQLLPGDLVLFGADVHHVGMYIGAGYMINAPYTGAYVRIDRIAGFGDFSLAVRP